jgi:hypothetical protein
MAAIPFLENYSAATRAAVAGAYRSIIAAQKSANWAGSWGGLV